jgi:hypothetical protein
MIVKGHIRYVPGEEVFQVLAPTKLALERSKTLAYVEQRVFTRWIQTGVQFALNFCVFKLLNCVHPVEDEKEFSDKKSNILSDVVLVPYNATLSDVASQLHSACSNHDSWNRCQDGRQSACCIVRDRDVIKLVAAAEPRSRRRD